MQEPRELAKMLVAKGPTIDISLSNSGGYVALNWENTGAIGTHDYVALYDKPPTDPYGYLTNQWAYVSNHDSPYVTGTSALGTEGPQYWIAYCAYDYKAGEYEVVAKNGPTRP